MLLKDYKEWKDKMENKMLPGRVEHISQGTVISDKKIDISSFAAHSVVFLRTKSGPNGLYYNANIIGSIKETYENELDNMTCDRDYWRSRCEDIQTGYNLMQSSIQHADKRSDEQEEKIKILSEALTRSKSKERGTKIYISRLRKQLNGNSTRRISKSRASR